MGCKSVLLFFIFITYFISCLSHDISFCFEMRRPVKGYVLIFFLNFVFICFTFSIVYSKRSLEILPMIFHILVGSRWCLWQLCNVWKQFIFQPGAAAAYNGAAAVSYGNSATSTNFSTAYPTQNASSVQSAAAAKPKTGDLGSYF